MCDTRSIDRPCHVLQGPSTDELVAHVRVVAEAFAGALAEALSPLLVERTAEALLHAEQAVQRLVALAADHVVGGAVAWLHEDRGWTAEQAVAARRTDPRGLRHRGARETVVRFVGGAQLRFTTPYLSTDREGDPGPRRRVGRHGREGGGCHPVLESLGIFDEASPAFASHVACEAVRCGSFEEAAQVLRERGVAIDAKAVRTLALSVGNEGLRQRDERKAAAGRGAVFSDEFAGKRIVVSADGGRLRTRQGGKRGRKGKRGRRRYRTPWREPRLVSVYVIDDQGRKVRCLPPLYDGTLGNPDAVFGILIAELLLRGAAKAKQIIVAGDGAPWIWNRVHLLATALHVEPERIVRVADFYHAVEHLSAIAQLRSAWTEPQQRDWVRTMRRRLKKGKVDAVIDSARRLCRGRNASAIATEVAYFQDRRDFMRYDHFQQQRIPLGSGAMESAVRRVVNLRLKGPGIFWREPSAEAMLHLRAYLKASRWDELVARVLNRSPDGRRKAPQPLPQAVAA